MKLVVTLDTEADNQWQHGVALRTENVASWPAFQEIADRYEVRSTYLITSEIAADGAAQAILKQWLAAGTVEVGAHLHAWTTPPFTDLPGQRHNDPEHAYLHELSDDLIRAKLIALTDEIHHCIGVRPTSFRSGRWGFDARVALELSRLGYEVDSTVTPYTSWRRHSGLAGRSGGPDFRRQRPFPFLINGSGEASIVEIPVMILPTNKLLRHHPWTLGVYRSLPMGKLRRLGARSLGPQPVWLRPSPPFSLADLCDCWRVAEERGCPVAVMMFHSSELMPGGSPYRRSAEAVDSMLLDLEGFFAFATSHGAVSLTLSEAAKALRASGRLQVRDL